MTRTTNFSVQLGNSSKELEKVLLGEEEENMKNF